MEKGHLTDYKSSLSGVFVYFWLLFTCHYSARRFGMYMPKSRDIQREFMRLA